MKTLETLASDTLTHAATDFDISYTHTRQSLSWSSNLLNTNICTHSL